MKSVRKLGMAQEDEHFWPSFTDVMSSMVFVLFFLIVLLFIKQIISARTWDLERTRVSTALAEKQNALDQAEKDLNSINSELDKRKQEMAGLEESLSKREARIHELEDQLLRDQRALIQKESELNDVRGQLEEISVFRLSILKEVKASIESELGKVNTAGAPLVTIDDNANLVIQSSLLFAKGSSEISESGRKMLRQFSLAFGKVLANPSVRESIDSIVISGYADSDDIYQNNYMLSCERAVKVITTMMKENPILEKSYGSYFQASGFSEFRPLVNGSDEASKAKNRRIQISINVKDTHIQKIINDYMNKQP